MQDPVVVLVKEYLPGSKAVAINELQVLALPPGCRCCAATAKATTAAAGASSLSCLGTQN